MDGVERCGGRDGTDGRSETKCGVNPEQEGKRKKEEGGGRGGQEGKRKKGGGREGGEGLISGLRVEGEGFTRRVRVRER
jgi:hypothetical protein